LTVTPKEAQSWHIRERERETVTKFFPFFFLRKKLPERQRAGGYRYGQKLDNIKDKMERKSYKVHSGWVDDKHHMRRQILENVKNFVFVLPSGSFF